MHENENNNKEYAKNPNKNDQGPDLQSRCVTHPNYTIKIQNLTRNQSARRNLHEKKINSKVKLNCKLRKILLRLTTNVKEQLKLQRKSTSYVYLQIFKHEQDELS